MEGQPLVSVIIPTYNRPELLKLTLSGIMAQTYSNYEILVVDDGSPTDEAEKVCRPFEKVKYYKIENSGGPAKPRNTGIQKAKGKYLAFTDDDDLWLPEKLEKQVNILEKNPDFGLVHGCCEVIDEKGELQNRIIGRLRNPEEKHGDVSQKMLGRWTVMMPTSFIRKTVVDKVGFFNETMPPAGEDMEFWARCSFETKFYYQDEPLVYYRVHGNNISDNKKGYQELPLHLKKVLDEVFEQKKITLITYKLLNQRLGILFVSRLKQNPLWILRNMKVFDSFWFIKRNYVKHLIASILKRH